MSTLSLRRILIAVAFDSLMLVGFLVTFLVDVPVVPWLFLATSLISTPVLVVSSLIRSNGT